jgi:hypothetical protein
MAQKRHQRIGDRTTAQAGEMHDHEFDAIGKSHRNHVTGIHPHADQPGRDATRQTVELPIGATPLPPAYQRGHRDLVWMRRNGGVQMIKNGETPP